MLCFSAQGGCQPVPVNLPLDQQPAELRCASPETFASISTNLLDQPSSGSINRVLQQSGMGQ
jgi:hypothetical protein